MSRFLLIVVVLGFAAVAGTTGLGPESARTDRPKGMDVGSGATQSAVPPATGTATRYHLRTRTKRFYQRAAWQNRCCWSASSTSHTCRHRAEIC
jgi:hypothetical protein